jgi:hypothetical protein
VALVGIVYRKTKYCLFSLDRIMEVALISTSEVDSNATIIDLNTLNPIATFKQGEALPNSFVVAGSEHFVSAHPTKPNLQVWSTIKVCLLSHNVQW